MPEVAKKVQDREHPSPSAATEATLPELREASLEEFVEAKKQRIVNHKEQEVEEPFVGLSEAIEAKAADFAQETEQMFDPHAGQNPQRQTLPYGFPAGQPQIPPPQAQMPSSASPQLHEQMSQRQSVAPPYLPPPEGFELPNDVVRQGTPPAVGGQGQHSAGANSQAHMNQPMAFLPVMSGGVNGFPQQMTYMAVPVNVGQLYGNQFVGMMPMADQKTPKKRKRKNRLCAMPSCEKNARGRTKFCVRHGGGVRCSVQGCDKGARPHSTLCSAHGGGHRCLFTGCNKGALAKSVYCRRHGKMVAQKNASSMASNVPNVPML